MEMSVLWGALRRRWYLVLALAVLTLGAMYAVTQKVGPTYEATGTVLVYPPSQTSAPDGSRSEENPYLALGGVTQARDVVVRALTSKTVSDEFGETYPVGTSFEIVPDYTNSAPIILFTVEANDPQVATDALASLMDLAPVELDKLQAELRLPAAERVSADTLTRDEKPATTSKAMIRAALMTAAGLGGLGLLLIALVDGWFVGRRRADAEPVTKDTRAAGRPLPVSLHTVSLTAGAAPEHDAESARPAPAASTVTSRLLRRRRAQHERGEAS